VVERRGLYRVLVEKSEERRPLGRPRSRWEDNIEIDLQKLGCGSIDWSHLVQDRDRWPALVYVAMDIGAPIMRGIS
jgi:hypothetical protein